MTVGLLLTFYGDDFTGSIDSMEVLSLGGVPAVLFPEPPSRQMRAAFPEARAVGLAGTSRGQGPARIDRELPGAFAGRRALGAPICHYKTCSTVDSAPHVGSIGRAIDIGQVTFGGRFVPLVIGAPALKRYTAFGNLFATFEGTIYRIDRHPVLRDHPVTPMDEGDMTRHLARQTGRRIGLVDLLALRERQTPAAPRRPWTRPWRARGDRAAGPARRWGPGPGRRSALGAAPRRPSWPAPPGSSMP